MGEGKKIRISRTGMRNEEVFGVLIRRYGNNARNFVPERDNRLP